MNTAAGVTTRNGAARRAASSAPSARNATSTAQAVVAASAVTTRPAARSPPRPIRTSPTKNRRAPGGWPATWVGQLSSRGVRDPVDEAAEHRADVIDLAGRTEVLVGVAERPLDALRAVDVREREQPGQPHDVRRQQQPAPRQPLGPVGGEPPGQQRHDERGRGAAPPTRIPIPVQRRELIVVVATGRGVPAGQHRQRNRGGHQGQRGDQADPRSERPDTEGVLGGHETNPRTSKPRGPRHRTTVVIVPKDWNTQ